MVIDIDKLFEDYFKKFISENMGKYTEDELESKVSEVYNNFGNTKLESLGGKTPICYFEDMSTSELVNTLEECVNSNLPVSEYLCDELEKRSDAEQLLINFVSDKVKDELATYAVNILNSTNSKTVFNKYVQVLKDFNAADSLIESITEVLSENADQVKEEILSVYNKDEKSAQYFIEILSCSCGDDRVFDLLCQAFLDNQSNLALYATYLSKYGDDRALPILYQAIKKEGLSYIDYKELKLAIEALGGEYEDDRNFSKDKYFKKLSSN